ncbi:MAG: cytochrome-c peroxidase [Sandaracinaceae bacterium]|nr:cytochrome-c peroxidase [Sandaracinaceae bacterium]
MRVSLRVRSLSVIGLGLVVGCRAGNDAHVPSAGPPPIAGGTLLVTRGSLAIASDPDRAAIHVVDIQTQRELHRVDLEETDEPGRAVEDESGLVHVVLRRAGQVLTLDAARGAITSRRDVCRAPRGIDVQGSDLVVACATGELVRLPAAGGGVTERRKIEPDLRDVIALDDGRLLVSRFRSAELLVIEDGAVALRMRPPSGLDGFGAAREPHVAWRIVRHPLGALMLHQEATSSQLGTLGVRSGVYYGGECDTGVVRSVVTLLDIESGTTRGLALDQTSLAVDLAFDGLGTIFVAAAAEPGSSQRRFSLSRSGARSVTLASLEAPQPDPADPSVTLLPLCPFASNPDYMGREASAIGVVAMPEGGVLVQYRDPALLEHGRYVPTSTPGSPALVRRSIALDAGPALSLGHAVFHESAGTGATCAGCHPEGGDDGHVWRFDVGPRRTQTLSGGILGTAPFHWAGDVADITSVMEGTFVGRMGGDRPRDDEIVEFARWMDALPAVPAPPPEDAGALDRGRAVFERASCESCHSGPRFTNNQTVSMGPEPMQVPALLEVAYRAPYLHDGSAPTLDALVLSHAGGPALSATERADLVHYLGSL